MSDQRAETGNRKQEKGNRKPQMRIGADIAERLMVLAVEVLQLVERLPRHAAGRHLGFQLARSVTSGGAHYEEARAAESRGDFLRKVGVSAKELRETTYWLELIGRLGWARDSQDLGNSARDLAAILGASARTPRNNANPSDRG